VIKLHRLTATQLRIILSISLFAILAMTVTLAFFAYGGLRGTAIDVSHAGADADASQTNLQILQQIQQKLAEEKDVIERANSIVADSKSYQYQDQILTDLKDYASKAGITITNIDFAASATAATPGSAPPATTAPAPTGVKTTSVSVTLKNPIDYVSLLRFIKSIEQNLTKMQISKISLAKGTTGSDVSSEALTIEVYIR
jgi:hypothetical protein